MSMTYIKCMDLATIKIKYHDSNILKKAISKTDDRVVSAKSKTLDCSAQHLARSQLFETPIYK